MLIYENAENEGRENWYVDTAMLPFQWISPWSFIFYTKDFLLVGWVACVIYNNHACLEFCILPS